MDFKCDFCGWPHPNLTAHVREQVDQAIRQDNNVIETACEMSLLDEDCRGVLVDRISGAVYLSHDVPFGEIHEYIDEEVEGRSAIRVPRLFLRKDSDD